MRALSIGASTVLISVWPVLKSLPQIGILRSVGELAQRGDVDGEVGRAVGERHALEERGVGVEHRRGDRRVVGVDRRLERLEVHVRRAGLDEDLGAEPHQIITTRSTCFSSRKRLMSSRIALSIARLLIGVHHVVGVEALDVLAVERGRHRAHLAQRVGDCLDVLAAFEHAGACRGDVGVVGERIPGAEHDVVERGERHEVLDQRAAVRRCACRAGSCPSGSASRPARPCRA